jgi:hypothetical protein
MPFLFVTAKLLSKEISRAAEEKLLTFLPYSYNLDTDQDARINDIVTSVNEVLECHQASQCLAPLESKWCFAQHTFVVMFMNEEMTAAVSFREDTRE